MNVIAPDYADRSDDELLNLALDSASLTLEARDALSSELKRRGLSSPEHLSRFAEEQKSAEIADLNDQIRRLGLSWRGLGRKLYGKSNVEIFGTSEQYDATVFLVAYYIPFIPTRTYRLSREQGAKESRVLESKPLNWGQVFWIWAKTLAIFGAIVLGFRVLHALGIIP